MSAVAGAAAGAPEAGRTIGIGVLGCADIALRRFLPAAVCSDRVRLVAVASREMEKASSVARSFACAAMNYRDLLKADEVDLVYIPLPNHLHEDAVIKALDRGKHVLCEKPLGPSRGSVARMLDAARRNGVLLYENIMYLQHPQHGYIKEILAAGRIGTVTGLHCVFTIPGPMPGDFRLDPRQGGGGAFQDLNRYPLTAARYFLSGGIGEIVHCDSTWRSGMIMSMTAQARTTANERLGFAIAFAQPYRCFYEISGTKGMLRLKRAFTTPSDHEGQLELCCDGRAETILLPAHDHFRLTIDHVAALIAGGDYAAEHDRALSLAHAADHFLQHAHS